MAVRGSDWAAWVESLPALVRGLYDDWELRPDGWMMHGYCALVVPVRTPTGARAMLKVAFPEQESEHEHLALSHWGGNGAVPLLRADPRRRAMLLDALRAVSLRTAGDIEACTVVGELYGRLHVPAFNQLRSLATWAASRAEVMATLPRGAPLPHRLLEQAASLARDLAGDASTTGTLVHGDLHHDNVLLSEAGEWLAIDPKPVSGDPHFEVAPMLWNRFDELTDPDRGLGVRAGVRRRFHTVVDTAGLEEDRARDWVVVRMVDRALGELRDAERAGRAPDEDMMTTAVTIIKAVQD